MGAVVARHQQHRPMAEIGPVGRRRRCSRHLAVVRPLAQHGDAHQRDGAERDDDGFLQAPDPLKPSNQLNMRRPEKLVYGRDGADGVAALRQDGCVAGKTVGVAGDIGDDGHLAPGQGTRLAFRARARRVQHHGAIGRQFQRGQRQLEQVADFGGDGFQARRRMSWLRRPALSSAAASCSTAWIFARRASGRAKVPTPENRSATILALPTIARDAGLQRRSPSAVDCRKRPGGSCHGMLSKRMVGAAVSNTVSPFRVRRAMPMPPKAR